MTANINIGSSIFMEILGIVLITLKLAEIGVVATWSWWLVLLPVYLPIVLFIITFIGIFIWMFIQSIRSK